MDLRIVHEPVHLVNLNLNTGLDIQGR